MSGRHRKPTTKSVSVAKIAVTGAVLSGSSIGLAAGAQAASDSEWDTVAACESSGNWAINTGNGYHGGLQFSSSTWLGYGGGQFASAANLASRDQQIAIAEKVLAGQGRGAWPVCGRGLSGPSQRNVSTTSVKAHTQVPAAPADTPADAPAPAATEGTPAPQDLLVPAPQDAVPAPEGAPAPADLPAPAPQDAAPAPEGVPAPAPEGAPAPLPAAPEAPAPQAPEAPAPQDGAAAPLVPAAPQPEIISISDTIVGPDQVVTIDAVASTPIATVVPAGLTGPAPLAPADPAVPPPAIPTAVVPVPVDPAAAPAPAAAAPVAVSAPAAPGDPAAPAAPAPAVVAVGQLQDGVQHLPSPDAPPPGTSTDPGQAGNPNVSYLKELWHAVQNQEIDKNDLLLALAQRSFTSPIPADAATPAPAPAPAG